MTTVAHDPDAYRRTVDGARERGARIGLVPTMGALHEGHLSLIRAARRHDADFLAVSIFVNPLQFGPSEDYARYPRTLDHDLERCRELGVDVVFAPDTEGMYPPGFQTRIDVGALTETLEGVHRPGHFRGVTTVVGKLFNRTGPCIAVFGRKDYQQWKVVQRMTRDLDMPITVVAEPTVREPDGLALSSRNGYLDPAERRRALGIVAGLRAASAAWTEGERGVDSLHELASGPIRANFDRVDYAAVVDPETLEPLRGRVEGRALVAAAAWLGSTRLIDNMVLGEDPRP